MKYLYTILLLLNSFWLLGQNGDCNKLDNLIKQGTQFEKDSAYILALNKYFSALVAAKNCLKAKNAQEDVKKRINDLFEKITKQKEKLDSQNTALNIQSVKLKMQIKIANQAKIAAIKASNKATATYWLSESVSINPMQGLGLLEKAKGITNDTKTLEAIKKQESLIFNTSNYGQFQERSSFLLYSNRININEYAFSSDCKWLIIQLSNGKYEIWDIKNKKKPDFLKKESIVFTKFSSDSKCLITIEHDTIQKYKVYDLSTEKELEFIKAKTAIEDISYSPDNKYLIWSIKENGEDRYNVWDLLNRKKYFENEKNYVDFSKDGRWLITRDINSQDFLFCNQKNAKDSLCKKKGIRTHSFSGDNKWLITRGKKYESTIWQLSDNSKEIKFSANNDTLFNAEFSKDSKWMMAWINGEYKAWNLLDTGKPENQPKSSSGFRWIIVPDNTKGFYLLDVSNNLEKETFVDYMVDFVKISSDDNWAITRNKSGLYRIWNISKNGKNPLLVENLGNLQSADFLKDNKWLIIKQGDKISLKSLLNKNGFPENAKGISECKLSEDNKWLITKNQNNEYKFWSVADTIKKAVFLDDREKFTNIVFGKESNSLITIDSYTKCKFWDLNNTKTSSLVIADSDIESITISTDNKWVATKYKNGRSDIWDSLSRKILPTSTDAKFSNDNKWLLITKSDNSYELWDSTLTRNSHFNPNGVEKAEFSINGQWINIKHILNRGYSSFNLVTDKFESKKTIDSTFSLEKKWLITTNMTDDYKTIWNWADKKQYDFFSKESIIYATFSKDSKWLITSNKRDVHKIWDLTTKSNPTLIKKYENIYKAMISADNKYMITKHHENDDKKVYKIWDLSKKEEILKNENQIHSATFSGNGLYLTILTGHQIKTYELANLAKPIQTLWVNKKPTQAQIIKNQYLYVAVGKAIIKMDLHAQRGDFFSYGDSEPLDYTHEEIKDWKGVFGSQYLMPLDKEIKEKYGIKK
ncbi:hypothetical protein [Emticicia sp. C21]|uniref:hypothetical protein n=1 Tax=Emticicia sp. C21 TaxID=2302915 RepID=UPI000E3507D6|nr:hypothetical protein [Emticicia sp. C21]RFS17350.1 hypothetical protein D0T08_06105 [Emticicia sp. C21]